MVKNMHFIRRYFGMGILFLALAFFMTGCEGEKNDPTGSEAYFDNNQYSSDERTDASQTLNITPIYATIDIVGGKVVFTASGGVGTYHWSVSNDDNGQVTSSGANQCVYLCKRVGNNDVIVTDDGGHFASANVTPVTDTMSVTPESVILVGTERYVAFTVTGGTPPYTWTSGNASLGAISYSATTSYTAGYTAVSGAYGENTISVRDAEGRVATASVEQPEPE
ncbi:hypothetical protein ACFLQL_01460 [Verrucomicrobiota bacterium]